jgi:hypothetical protein
MQTIPTTFRKHEADFTLISRQGDVALYARKAQAMIGFEYEIIIVQKLPERQKFGKLYPAHEALPSDSQWGTSGWSTNRWWRAEEIFTREVNGRGFADNPVWKIDKIEDFMKSATGE